MMMEANVIFKCQICSADGFMKRHGSARLAERPVITKPGPVGRAAVARTGGVRRDGIGDGGGTEGGEARERSPPCDVKARVE